MIIGAERHAGRSASGKRYFLSYSYVSGDLSPSCKPYTPLRAPLTHQARSRTFSEVRTSQSTKNFPVRQPPPQKTRRIYSHQIGGCRAGKFGEMREVWRGKNPIRKGGLPPPRPFPYPPAPCLYRNGLTPCARRKTREKYSASEKPQRSEISPSVMSVRRSIFSA